MSQSSSYLIMKFLELPALKIRQKISMSFHGKERSRVIRNYKHLQFRYKEGCF